jgi:hypothetical protein
MSCKYDDARWDVTGTYEVRVFTPDTVSDLLCPECFANGYTTEGLIGDVEPVEGKAADNG